MVKFQEYYVPKKLKRRKTRYQNFFIRIPKECQPKIKPYLDIDFDMTDIVAKETSNGIVLDIVLTAQKQAIRKELKQTA